MRIVKIYIIAILVMLSTCGIAMCGMDEDRAKIKTPEDIAKLLSKEYSYEWRIASKWHTAEETLESKRGSCKDLATLSQSLLADIGIRSDIIVIRFKGLKISHAVCTWMDEGGYSFMTNRGYVKTGAQSLEGALDAYYPDWKEIVFTTPDGKYGEVIKSDDNR